MYHSITFDSKNSYSDWYLVPEGRPSIAMPPQKTNYVDIPGASGALDLSETLTKYPVYENRTGSLSFIVLNGLFTNAAKANESWASRYSEIAKYVHGRRIKIILEDDSNYYYEGRVTLGEWESPNDVSGYSKLSMDYTLDPYKYAVNETVHTYTHSSSSIDNLHVGNEVGRMPVVPTFEVSDIGTSGVDVTVTNPELKISTLKHSIKSNGTYNFYDMILSRIKDSNDCVIAIQGQGTIKVRYRKGEL